MLKELRKLWEKLEPGLPWEKGEFHESNTLLVDDSPYKALVNPVSSCCFPFIRYALSFAFLCYTGFPPMLSLPLIVLFSDAYGHIPLLLPLPLHQRLVIR